MITVCKWSPNDLKLPHFWQALCGLPINTYFSAVKLRWLLDNCEAVKKAAEEDRCLFGTVDSWLIWVWNVHYIVLYFVTLTNHAACWGNWHKEFVAWTYNLGIHFFINSWSSGQSLVKILLANKLLHVTLHHTVLILFILTWLWGLGDSNKIKFI